MSDTIESIEESIRCRIFGYNKAQGKTDNPVFVNEEQEFEAAIDRLKDRLVELAFEYTDL